MLTPHLKELLDAKVDLYERPDFIPADPISIPHRYSRRQDIEVAGLLAATIAWGNRKAIVSKANQMADRLGSDPFDFVMSASDSQIDALSSFVYRTFQKEDLPSMVRGLRRAYSLSPSLSLEDLFLPSDGESLRDGIARFRDAMTPDMAQRSLKHIPNPASGSAAKRICMFLRWMVRSSARGAGYRHQGLSSHSMSMPLARRAPSGCSPARKTTGRQPLSLRQPSPNYAPQTPSATTSPSSPSGLSRVEYNSPGGGFQHNT